MTAPEVMARYLDVTSSIAAIRYVPYAQPTPLLFQFALRERTFGKSTMEQYYTAASEPKQIKWYDTGHELNDIQALVDRASWLHDKIGLNRVSFLPKGEN